MLIKPYVYLIGAGPGDEALITVKGMDSIQKADVILYDRLINTSLLKYAKEEAETIDVGKSPNCHPYSQEEINELIVHHAQEGKIVARLKGGDPYVFGRGGEEALALAEAGISFEVVPGITSAIGALNYGGIPVTHRNISTSFHVITGHENPLKENSTVNYEALAKLEGTLIFLMGMGNLKEITARLMEHGKNMDTPVALVHRGTTARQRVVMGTLETIENIAKAEEIKSPSIIVVGEVVNLREKLNWYEKLPLQGKSVMVTRSRQQASKLSSQLKALGAEVIEFPTIALEINRDLAAIEDQIREIKNADHLIFTSTNGVKYFFERLRALKIDIRQLGACRVSAIGTATSKALEERGLIVELVPEEFTAEGMLRALKSVIRPGETVFLPQAEIARKSLAEGLRSLGAVVEQIPLYTTTVPKASRQTLIQALEGGIDIITFTSASTVRNLVEILGKENKGLLKLCKTAAIGPITAKALEDLDIRVDFQGEEHTIEGLIQEILEGVI